MSPTDKDAYFGEPDLFTPKYDEVYISVTFTWDKEKAERLITPWRKNGLVFIGGPAYESYPGDFIRGKYLRDGIVITSRGCPNKCDFCFVPKIEGELKEIPIVEGNIIQDNNILACSDYHWRNVLNMLKKQKAIEFKGGLEKYRITPKIAEDLRGLRIKTLWLACDQPQGIKPLRKAVEILYKAGFNQNHIYCYVLIGDDMVENGARLREVYNIGCMPFAQLYQSPERKEYSKAWKQFARTWSRPAAYKTLMKPSTAKEPT
jgi:hypothetical protein